MKHYTLDLTSVEEPFRTYLLSFIEGIQFTYDKKRMIENKFIVKMRGHNIIAISSNDDSMIFCINQHLSNHGLSLVPSEP